MGDKVEAKHGEKWYASEVVEVERWGKITIRADKGGKNYPMDPKDLRKKEEESWGGGRGTKRGAAWDGPPPKHQDVGFAVGDKLIVAPLERLL